MGKFDLKVMTNWLNLNIEIHLFVCSNTHVNCNEKSL